MAKANIHINGVINGYYGSPYYFQDEIYYQSMSEPITEIEVTITSPGGSALSGLTSYDVLRAQGMPIKMRATGECSSAASLILMAGEEREGSRSVQLCIHEPYLRTEGWQMRVEDLRNAADSLEADLYAYASIYAERTGQPIESMLALMKQDRYIGADEALSLGFLTTIVDTIPAPQANIRMAAMASTTDLKEAMSNKITEWAKTLLPKYTAKAEALTAEIPATEAAAETVALVVGDEIDLPDGTHEIETGVTITVKDGKVTNVMTEEEMAAAEAVAELVAEQVALAQAGMASQMADMKAQLEALMSEKAAREAKAVAPEPAVRRWPKTLPPVTGAENTNAEPQAQKKIVVNADGSSQSTLKRK